MSGFPLPSFGGHPPFPPQWLPDQSSGHSADSYQKYSQLPPQSMYGTNGAGFSSNAQIPGLGTFTNGMLPTPQNFPIPNATPTPYYSQPTHAQTSGPSVNFQPFLRPLSQSRSNGKTTHNPNISEQTIGEGRPTGLDQVETHDAMDLDGREEGELSNGEADGDGSHADHRANSQRAHKSPVIENQQVGDSQKQATLINCDPEVSSQNVTTATQALYAGLNAPSGDPNAPAYINTSTLRSLKDPFTLSEKGTTNGSHPQVPNGRSLTQLRMQAQGALLNLAPHNIRYRELVSEGIDPVILKDLYEGIGLKVTTGDSADKQAMASSQETEYQPPEAESTRGNAVPTSIVEMAPRQAPSTYMLPPESTTKLAVPTANSNTATNKPLERKDLIARMLAAKAGKSIATQHQEAAPPSASKNISPSQEPIPQPEPCVSMSGQAPTSEENRVKEKNRAQTELARQRIEQLKKMGLTKSQSQSTSDSVFGSPLTTTSPPIDTLPLAATQQDTRAFQPLPMKHPLPERPPDPETAGPPRIPGLFMTGAEPMLSEPPASRTSHQSAIIEASSSVVRVPRKRPRASDFTDDIVEIPPQKQQDQGTRISSSDHKVIIDISEDESMYDVDADESIDQAGAKFVSNSVQSKQMTIRDAPPLSDIAARPVQSYRSASSNSLPQTPGKGRDEENIRSEIMIMRQRIAELERRRDAKRAAQAQTTVAPNDSTLSSAGPTPNPQKAAKTLDFGKLPTPTQESQYPVVSPNQIPFGATAAMAPPSSPLTAQPKSPSARSWSTLEPKKAEDLRQKFLRKREIESGLPALEAELSRSEARLAQFREEEKKLLAEIAKGKAGKRRLIEELEELGIETEGLTFEELQLTKDRLEVEPDIQSPVRTQNTSDLTQAPEAVEHHTAPVQAISSPDEPLSLPHRLVEESCVSTAATVPQTSQEAMDVAAQSSEHTMPIPEREGSVLSSRSSSAMDESMGSSADDQEAMDEDETSSSASVSEGDRSPPSTQSGHLAKDLAVDVPMQKIPMLSEENSETNFASSPEQSVASDTYEPPEPDAEMQSDSSVAPPFSPAPVAPPQPVDVDSETMPLTQDVETLTLSDQRSPQPIHEENMEDVEDTGHHFTPYISPLRLFRAYRYHPNFVTDIEGGFRSLTYSHNIDHNRPLCEFEVSGGICNDQSCQNQHFRDMILSDDKILVEMGSLREGKTPADREEYVTGLKRIINDMRRDKVKDFNTVATEIAAYRRRFLQDPSRVLAL
uniref:Putative zinc-finger domain-containing protein n=1 Tax=Coccidioides posadasii RMSCC 3488 TaxID=454284 RepID=A0A0J6FC02_COCPO|nr:hypothetical protein CPAG_04131 [Coccidioides posadasii RMSCC 3488]